MSIGFSTEVDFRVSNIAVGSVCGVLVLVTVPVIILILDITKIRKNTTKTGMRRRRNTKNNKKNLP